MHLRTKKCTNRAKNSEKASDKVRLCEKGSKAVLKPTTVSMVAINHSQWTQVPHSLSHIVPFIRLTGPSSIWNIILVWMEIKWLDTRTQHKKKQ